jgi:hypothetical protein
MHLQRTHDVHDVHITYVWDGGPDIILTVNGADVAAFDLGPVLARAVDAHASRLTARDVELLLLESVWRTSPDDDGHEAPF